jgi:pimeloyl-ACP methyl ester carboxylesterase
MAYLKNRKEVDPHKVGIVGHSEGGGVAFILAAEHKDLSFIVSMAGPAIKGDVLMKEQRRLLSTTMGVPKSSIDENEKLIQDMNKLVLKHTADSLLKHPDKYINEIIPAYNENNEEARRAYKAALMQYASPQIQSLLNYDPAKMIEKIECPVLAIYGEKDLQVPAAMNIESLQAYGKSNITTKKYPDLNHLFQHAKTGLPAEYESIEETISTEVLQDIVDWIKGVTK